jgi:hypothetical protein
MKFNFLAFSAWATATFCLPLAAQYVLVSGNSLGHPHQEAVLADLGYSVTTVSPFEYGTHSLVGYHAIWLDGFSQYSPGTPGNPGLSADSLISFMNGGGVVLVENPGFGSERLTAYPFGAELLNQYVFGNSIRILDSTSPVFAGVDAAGLSGWIDPPSTAGFFAGGPGSFHGVADTGTAGEWTTLVRSVGAGYLVYTDQPMGLRIETAGSGLDSAEVRFLNNVIAIPEPRSAALLLLGFGALPLLRRARRRAPPCG